MDGLKGVKAAILVAYGLFGPTPEKCDRHDRRTR
jgi:hypothetical protein